MDVARSELCSQICGLVLAPGVNSAETQLGTPTPFGPDLRAHVCGGRKGSEAFAESPATVLFPLAMASILIAMASTETLKSRGKFMEIVKS